MVSAERMCLLIMIAYLGNNGRRRLLFPYDFVGGCSIPLLYLFMRQCTRILVEPTSAIFRYYISGRVLHREHSRIASILTISFLHGTGTVQTGRKSYARTRATTSNKIYAYEDQRMTTYGDRQRNAETKGHRPCNAIVLVSWWKETSGSRPSLAR